MNGAMKNKDTEKPDSTSNKARTIFLRAVTAVIIAAIITLTWIGAEYIFEDSVHFGVIDGCVACLMSLYCLRELIRHSQN